jgi:hypothetical protein
MSDTQINRVYKMLDNLTDTMSWTELAKELDKYVVDASDADNSVNGETIEMRDLMKSLLEKNPPADENS